MKQPITIDEILDLWRPPLQISDVADVASDVDVWAFARLAVIIAGDRAQSIGNEEFEEACATFLRALGGMVGSKPLELERE